MTKTTKTLETEELYFQQTKGTGDTQQPATGSVAYYQKVLVPYLIDNFPERAEDEEFINSRCEMAADTYAEVMGQGGDVQLARYEANEVLFAGIKYSFFKLVSKAIDKHFHTDDEGEHFLFSLQMLERCMPFMQRYNTQDENFPGSEMEDLLYTEIIGEISMYLEKNGMN